MQFEETTSSSLCSESFVAFAVVCMELHGSHGSWQYLLIVLCVVHALPFLVFEVSYSTHDRSRLLSCLNFAVYLWSRPITELLLWVCLCLVSDLALDDSAQADNPADETLGALETPSQVYQVTIFQYHKGKLRSSFVGSNHVYNACILKDKFAKLPMST
jgi:hypothetical protein